MTPPVSIPDLKAFIIRTLDLEDLTPEDLGDDQPLFKAGLGLDSVDALELWMALGQRHGLKLDAGAALPNDQVTPRSLAAWVQAQVDRS